MVQALVRMLCPSLPSCTRLRSIPEHSRNLHARRRPMCTPMPPCCSLICLIKIAAKKPYGKTQSLQLFQMLSFSLLLCFTGTSSSQLNHIIMWSLALLFACFWVLVLLCTISVSSSPNSHKVHSSSRTYSFSCDVQGSMVAGCIFWTTMSSETEHFVQWFACSELMMIKAFFLWLLFSWIVRESWWWS